MAATTAKPGAVPAKADYGLDAPHHVRTLATRGATVLLLGFGLWFMNRETNPRGGTTLFIALSLIGIGFLAAAAVMVWSSRSGKLAMRDRILDSYSWRGDEKVLDVGCGRGLMLVGAARRLKTGRVNGVDIWNTADQSGNSSEATIANARAEGVADTVKVENADARRLPFQANSFDVVVSSLVLHNIAESTDRTKALDEMLRVVKPGGQIVIWDLLHARDYLQHLERSGAEVVQQSGLSFLWCVPSRWFIARKK